ncbi:hypothetical protein [Thermococcus sp.]|uniref:hypothetical protein n=1 Tax=Thermococcus sp. TaxID=35749 RepID=UPI002616CFEB|nr:hypothetical protein [Thermococcus sp.]
MDYVTISPEVLKAKSGIGKIHYYSFGEFLRGNCEIPHGERNAVVSVKFEIGSTNDVPSNLRYKYSDSILLDNLHDNIVVKLEKAISPIGRIKALLKIGPANKLSNISLVVNRRYYTIFKMKIENVIPPGILLKDATYLSLIHNNFIPLHSSAFAKDKNEGYIIMAPPNVGKTTTVLEAVKNGFYGLSEDISIANLKSKTVHAVPCTATQHHETKINKLLGPLSYFTASSFKTFGEEYRERIIPKAKIKGIFILEKGNSLLQELSSEEAFERIILLNRDEFKWHSDMIITAIQYYFPEIRIEHVEEEIINNLVTSIPVYLVREKSPFEYFRSIRDVI